jgi:hypothetical protein
LYKYLSHQAGEENGLNQKLVYSNPVDPSQCLVSLGIALICNSTMNTNRVLFNRVHKDAANELEAFLVE